MSKRERLNTRERLTDGDRWSRRNRLGRIRDAAPAVDAPKVDRSVDAKVGRARADPPIGTNGNSLVRSGAGRPAGSTDLIPRSIKGLIKEAMERHGADGQGREGALGYLTMLAKDHKGLFVSLIRRTLPVQLKAELDAGSLMAKLLQTASAARAVREGNANGAGNGSNVIDVTPSRTRRSFSFDDDR